MHVISVDSAAKGVDLLNRNLLLTFTPSYRRFLSDAIYFHKVKTKPRGTGALFWQP